MNNLIEEKLRAVEESIGGFIEECQKPARRPPCLSRAVAQTTRTAQGLLHAIAMLRSKLKQPRAEPQGYRCPGEVPLSVPSCEPWMAHVAVRLTDEVPVLRYCRRCGALACYCADRACLCFHHAEGDNGCLGDISPEEVLAVPLSAEQIVRYQLAEHERRLLFEGEDPAWEGRLT